MTDDNADAAKTEAETEEDKRTHEERRADSIKQNTHDEASIKKLNATFTLKEIPDGDSEEDRVKQKAYCSELVEEVIKTIDGISTHLENDFVMVKEHVRNNHNTRIEGWKSPQDTRFIATTGAKDAEKELRRMFKDMAWATESMQRMFGFIEEQSSKSETLVGKGKRTVKEAPGKILGGSWNVAKKVVGKGGKHRVN